MRHSRISSSTLLAVSLIVSDLKPDRVRGHDVVKAGKAFRLNRFEADDSRRSVISCWRTKCAVVIGWSCERLQKAVR
jgi:hypothetical protein